MEPNMLQEMRSDMCDKPEQALGFNTIKRYQYLQAGL